MVQPSEVSKSVRLQVYSEIMAVLEKHYWEYITKGSNLDGYAAWSIMQDVRKHLDLTEEDTRYG